MNFTARESTGDGETAFAFAYCCMVCAASS